MTPPGMLLSAGTCALPLKRDNPDGSTSLFAHLNLSETSDPAGPATCDKALQAAMAAGGTLPVLRSAADLRTLRNVTAEAAGKPVWVSAIDTSSPLAAALGYTAAPAAGQAPALMLSGGNVVVQNVACSTEGVAVAQSDVVGGAPVPATLNCAGEEGVKPAGQECSYAVLNASRPVSRSAAEDLARALGKRMVSFASEAEYVAVRESLAGSRAAALLARGALAGLWVDMASSAYLPDGYTLPGAGQASMLAGTSLTPKNVPVASSAAAVLVEKCSEIDDSIGEP